MDEFMAALKARELVQRVNSSSIPASIQLYTQVVGCEFQVQYDLAKDEPGYAISHKGKHRIVVNGNDCPERQRFTACHELGHIVLALPSEHAGSPSWSYRKRPPNEIYCDVFAAELLLPYRLFKPLVDAATVGFDALDDLSRKFEASVTATGSRLAAATDALCAFVLSEGGKVRYASRSKALREAGAWIPPRTPMPHSSLSAIVRSGQAGSGVHEIAADMWFSDWKRGGSLLEEARYLKQWDQTLTLLWFDDEELPQESGTEEKDEEEMGLKELDGVLPWPGKRRRRR